MGRLPRALCPAWRALSGCRGRWAGDFWARRRALLDAKPLGRKDHQRDAGNMR